MSAFRARSIPRSTWHAAVQTANHLVMLSRSTVFRRRLESHLVKCNKLKLQRELEQQPYYSRGINVANALACEMEVDDPSTIVDTAGATPEEERRLSREQLDAIVALVRAASAATRWSLAPEFLSVFSYVDDSRYGLVRFVR